jgi:hypothetical protein
MTKPFIFSTNNCNNNLNNNYPVSVLPTTTSWPNTAPEIRSNCWAVSKNYPPPAICSTRTSSSCKMFTSPNACPANSQ